MCPATVAPPLFTFISRNKETGTGKRVGRGGRFQIEFERSTTVTERRYERRIALCDLEQRRCETAILGSTLHQHIDISLSMKIEMQTHPALHFINPWEGHMVYVCVCMHE